MKNFSKEKRDRIILTVMGTAVLVAGGWYGAVNVLQGKLAEMDKTIGDQRIKVGNAKRLVGSKALVEERVAATTTRVRELESQMASGDMYSWLILKVNKFRVNYKVDIPSFTREVTSEVQLLPDFPYRAATFTVKGTAFYHDFGRFLADFENTFPYMRVQSLELEPAASSAANATSSAAGDPDWQEKLAFRMEIVALINPGAN